MSGREEPLTSMERHYLDAFEQHLQSVYRWDAEHWRQQMTRRLAYLYAEHWLPIPDRPHP